MVSARGCRPPGGSRSSRPGAARAVTSSPRHPAAAPSRAGPSGSRRAGPVKHRYRLLRSSDFDRTLKAGRRASSAYLALFVSDNELGRPRVGLAVSRKLGNAVVRNTIKRRLREAVRPLVMTAQLGRDVVIVARARAVDAEYARLRQELEMLWAKGFGQ
jgi:ribonuclease P protein component